MRGRRAGLVIGESRKRIRDLEPILEALWPLEIAIPNRELRVRREAGVPFLYVGFPVVVLCNAPRAAGVTRPLSENTVRGPPQAEAVVGRIKPVVHRPRHVRGLMLDVG